MAGPAAQVRIRLDTRNADRQLDSWNQRLMRGLGIPQKHIAKLQAGLVVAANAFAVVGTAAVAASSKAIGAWSSLEKAILEVQTIADDAALSMGRISSEARRLAEEHGIDAQTQVRALYQTISAGVSDAEDAIQLLGVANQLAIGGLTDTATAVDGLTSAINAFGLDAARARQVSDTMFQTVKAGKTTIDQYSRSLGQVASTAAAAGLSFEEMSAAIATITTRGVQTSEAVTQLRNLLNAVAGASDTQKKAARALGVELSTQEIRSQGYLEFMRNLSEATDNSQEKLLEMLGSSEAVSAVLNQTADGGDRLAATLNRMTTEVGSTEEAANKMAGSVENSWNRFTALLENQSSAFGEAISSTGFLQSALEGLGETIKVTGEIAKLTFEGFGDMHDFFVGIERIGNMQGLPFPLRPGAEEGNFVEALAGDPSLVSPQLTEEELKTRRAMQREARKQMADDAKTAHKERLEMMDAHTEDFLRHEEEKRKRLLKSEQELQDAITDAQRVAAEHRAQQDAAQREADEQRVARHNERLLSSISTMRDMTASIMSSIEQALAVSLERTTRDMMEGAFQIDKFIGGLVQSIGNALIGIGSAAVAGGIIGLVAPWLRGSTGGVDAIAAGGAAIAVGAGLSAAGSAISGANSAGSVARNTRTFGTGGGQSGVSSVSRMGGSDLTPLSTRQTISSEQFNGAGATTVFNVNLNGPIGGSPRSIATGLQEEFDKRSLRFGVFHRGSAKGGATPHAITRFAQPSGG